MPYSGIYRTDCKCRLEVTMNRFTRFSTCRRCERPVNWLLIRALRIKQELVTLD